MSKIQTSDPEPQRDGAGEIDSRLCVAGETSALAHFGDCPSVGSGARPHQPDRHCHVGRKTGVVAIEVTVRKASFPDLDTRLLLPNPKGARAEAPVTGCCHQVTPWAEMTIDDTVRR
jgi:hypothetical protein